MKPVRWLYACAVQLPLTYSDFFPRFQLAVVSKLYQQDYFQGKMTIDASSTICVVAATVAHVNA